MPELVRVEVGYADGSGRRAEGGTEGGFPAWRRLGRAVHLADELGEHVVGESRDPSQEPVEAGAIAVSIVERAVKLEWLIPSWTRRTGAILPAPWHLCSGSWVPEHAVLLTTQAATEGEPAVCRRAVVPLTARCQGAVG